MNTNSKNDLKNVLKKYHEKNKSEFNNVESKISAIKDQTHDMIVYTSLNQINPAWPVTNPTDIKLEEIIEKMPSPSMLILNVWYASIASLNNIFGFPKELNAPRGILRIVKDGNATVEFTQCLADGHFEANSRWHGTCNSRVFSGWTPEIKVINPNLLINGDFQVWQRGTTFDLNDKYKQYTADRWMSVNYKDNSTDKFSISKQSNGSIGLSGNWSSSGTQTNKYGEISQYIEKKQEGTYTFTVKARGKGNLRLFFYYDGHTSYSPINYFTLSDEYKEFSATIAVSGEKRIEPTIRLECTSLDTDLYMDVAWAKVEKGRIKTEFVSKTYIEELRDCQRYYWASSGPANMWTYGHCTLGSGIMVKFSHLNNMMKVPTAIFKNNDGKPQVFTSIGWQDVWMGTVSQDCLLLYYDDTISVEKGKSYLMRYLPDFDAEIY